MFKYSIFFLVFCSGTLSSQTGTINSYNGNPIIRNIFTADPAALVYKDTFYLYTGHDEQLEGGNGFVMNDWHIFSSTDMKNWTDLGPKLSINTFSWAKSDAWAGQCVEKNGKFYWYVPMSHKTINGFAIGVAVGNSPKGPFTDAKGLALITNDMTTDVSITWDDIDPTVFVDDDGQAYLYWGNTSCKYVKLKSNMIEIDGPIQYVTLPGYTEAPWLHKHNGYYFLTYASSYPEFISYATSKSPIGPWTYRGFVNSLVKNSPTNHEAILEFKGAWYFVYHDGALPTGGEFRRSVCIDTLYYDNDSTMRKIKQTLDKQPVKIEMNSSNDNQHINLFPNPIKGQVLQIKLPNNDYQGIVKVDILGMTGESVFCNEYTKTSIIPLNINFKSGIYAVNVFTKEKMFSEKLIVE
jgi:beta-xylosidase